MRLTRTLGSCPNWTGTCPAPSVGPLNPPNCPCDMTSPNSFCTGNTSYTPASHPCGCPQLNCEVRPANIWPILHVGQSITFTDTQAPLFTFFAWNAKCSAYIVRITSPTATPPIPVVQDIPQVLPLATLSTAITDPNVFMVCPGSPFWGKTVVIANVAWGQGQGNITFALEMRDMPPARAPLPPLCSSQLDSTHLCINPGRTFEFKNVINEPTILRFVVPVDKPCGTF